MRMLKTFFNEVTTQSKTACAQRSPGSEPRKGLRICLALSWGHPSTSQPTEKVTQEASPCSAVTLMRFRAGLQAGHDYKDPPPEKGTHALNLTATPEQERQMPLGNEELL